MKGDKRVRRTVAGFVGANLAGDQGDLTLFNRLVDYCKRTTMSRSLVIRLALEDYLAKHDK